MKHIHLWLFAISMIISVGGWAKSLDTRYNDQASEVVEQDLQMLMKQIGEAFNGLKTAVLVNKSLGPDAIEKSQTLAALFYEVLPLVPNLDDVSPDPGQRDQLLIFYRKIMAETLAASYDAQLQIMKGDMIATTKAIEVLNTKRKQAHDIFRK